MALKDFVYIYSLDRKRQFTSKKTSRTRNKRRMRHIFIKCSKTRRALKNYRGILIMNAAVVLNVCLCSKDI